MLVKRKSVLSGKIHTMELPITPIQLVQFSYGQSPNQNDFPMLTPEQK